MDDSSGSSGDRWGPEDDDSEDDPRPAADPSDREVFRRGHPPGDEPRVVEPGADEGQERAATDGEGGNVAGPSPGSVRMPVEPGSPSAENVFFVLLGVALTLFVFARMAGI
jgi:hypothetical protein